MGYFNVDRVNPSEILSGTIRIHLTDEARTHGEKRPDVDVREAKVLTGNKSLGEKLKSWMNGEGRVETIPIQFTDTGDKAYLQIQYEQGYSERGSIQILTKSKAGYLYGSKSFRIEGLS